MGATAASESRAHRWQEEAAFFDEEAQETDSTTLPLDPLFLRRRSNMAFSFRVLGDVRGRTLLDVGCGSGLNGVMLAKMGAQVTGIDVSAKAIEVARRRAEVNGVSDHMTLIHTPIETADLADNSFDIVWGNAILHHLIGDVALVMDRAVRWAKPDGMVVFAEPVNFCEPLRRLRRLIPVHTRVTPGERPLVRAEIELIRQYVPDLRIRYFRLLGRIDRVILAGFDYEGAPRNRKTALRCIDVIDDILLSLPLAATLAGNCVMYGHPRKASSAGTH